MEGVHGKTDEFMKKMNGIMEYQLKLKKDHQIASGSVKLLQH